VSFAATRARRLRSSITRSWPGLDKLPGYSEQRGRPGSQTVPLSGENGRKVYGHFASRMDDNGSVVNRHEKLKRIGSVKRATRGARPRRFAGTVIAVILAGTAVAVALAAPDGHGTHQLVHHPPAGPLSGLRLYVDRRSPGAVQVASWRAVGDTADAAVLQRIAGQPIARWFAGGDPNPRAAAAALVNAAGAARSVAELVLYYIPGRDCHGYSSGGAATGAAYIAWVTQIAQGIGGREAVVVLEPDAVNQAADGCLPHSDGVVRYRLLSQAIRILKSNPRIRVYLDAGNPGWLPVPRIVGPLRRAGIEQADGFSLNVANFHTTRESISYGRSISRALGGRHFIVDIGRNGNGPPPGAFGTASWCNPPGRALGTAPTTSTGDPLVDALLWIKSPGESDGACHPGDPPAGEWWPAHALALARAAR